MSQGNTTIIKNSLFLYIRMFIMMCTSLYTYRLVLQILGVEDFGIYNLVSGVIVLFTFISGAMLTGTQRFLNFHIGQNNLREANNVFCMSLNIYILLALIMAILAETIGLWFLQTQLNIPSERIHATNYVYQFAIITFIVSFTRIPYNAAIISYERMNFYAYISIIEVILKLGSVFLLYVIPYDKLIIYSLSYTIITILINVAYYIYCKANIDITKYRLTWDWGTFRQLSSFSFWSLFGNAANSLAQQGMTFLINIFYGVAVNAAAGIANQVVGTVYQFVSNFQVAFNPQIIKSYAANEINKLNKLICQTSKFSYYLMLIIILPLSLLMDKVLSIWLVDVPEYTSIFCKLILIFFAIDAINAPLWMSVQATGKIRNYQILMSTLIILNIPAAYIALKVGFPVYSVWVVRIIINIITFVVRCLYMRKLMDFRLHDFIYLTMLPITLVTITAIPIPIIAAHYIDGYILNIVLTILTSLLCVMLSIYWLGMKQNERTYICNAVRNKILRR